jgi:hypothetical protein
MTTSQHIRAGIAVAVLAIAYYYLLLYVIGYAMTIHWPSWWYVALPKGKAAAQLWLVVLHTSAVLIAAAPVALLSRVVLYRRRVLLTAAAGVVAVVALNLPAYPDAFALSWKQHPIFLITDNLKCLLAVPLLAWLLGAAPSNNSLERSRDR